MNVIDPDSDGSTERHPATPPKKKEVLSFHSVGRYFDPEDLPGALEAEFRLMLSMLGKAPKRADFERIGMGSGSHLLKLTTARADVRQSVLRTKGGEHAATAVYAPSVNAPDIPLAKVVFRPLDIEGRPSKSVVDHLRNPDDISEVVLGAFAAVFGEDCLDGLSEALLGEGQVITSLPATGEFPVIFLPRPGGGDIQATPVSPVETFMGFKRMADAWFLEREKDMPPPPRGRWVKQEISSKPQNISAAIGGPRMRFLAEMPPVMRGYEAAVRRYALGGQFPRWRDTHVEAAVLQYDQRLSMEYTNKAIREGTDFYADRLIAGALEFIHSVLVDAREVVAQGENPTLALPVPPKPSAVILARKWRPEDKLKALRAVTSPHFRDRERIALERQGESK